MRALVKLGNGRVATEVLEKRPRSCLVRLPDGHIIVRKNWQIYRFIGKEAPAVSVAPKIIKPRVGIWKKLVELFKKIWYTLRGKR